MAQLARITDGFTGSEIDAAFTEAMFLGFERNRPAGTPRGFILSGYSMGP